MKPDAKEQEPSGPSKLDPDNINRMSWNPILPMPSQKRLIDNGTVAARCPNMKLLSEGTAKEPKR